MFSDFFFFPRIASKNVVEPDGLQMAIWRRFACWVSKVSRVQAHVSLREPTPARIRTH